MSGRRPRISARPNLGRNKRGAAEVPPTSSQEPPSDDSQLSTQASDASKDVTDRESVTQLSPSDQATQPAASEEAVEHVKDKDSPPPEGGRRAKIKAKPMISRKPRAKPNTPNHSASTTGTQAESVDLDVTDSQSESTVSQEKTIPDIIVETAETGQEEPVVQETGLLSPDSALSAGRLYKPRTKPNVLEAGRARMRRISESLDLSPNHPVNRRHRHNSTTGGDNPVKCVSQSEVSCEKKDSEERTVFHEAQAKARKRRNEKVDGEAEIDREIIEQEHAEMAAELEQDSKPRKTRKIRRVVKSDQAPDPLTMTIRDLIYYQPTSNPLPVKEPKLAVKKKKEEEGNEEKAEGSDCESVEADNCPPKKEEEDDLAPQLMVGEDGQVIINQQSLTVETAKPEVNYENITVDRDGEGATYASFRANRNTRFWSQKETAQFYKALSAIGTDFSLMCQLFPNRTRTDLKNKFKREERQSLAKVQLAMQGKLDFEAEPFPEYDKEKEREEKKKEQQAIRRDQKRAKEPRKVRAYYDVDNREQFAAKLGKRRTMGQDLRLGQAGKMTASEGNHAVMGAPKKLLQLNTQATVVETTPSHVLGELPDNQVTAEPAAGGQATLRPLQPLTCTPGRAMPSIATMLHQDQSINNKIHNLLLAKKTPPRRTSDQGEPLLSPLCQLDNGNTIMVQTQTIGGGDRKVHHLFLYASNKPGPQATGSIDPITIRFSPKATARPVRRLEPAIPSDTQQQVSSPPVSHSIDMQPVTDVVGAPVNRLPTSPLTSPVRVAPPSGQQEAVNLTRLVTPESLKDSAGSAHSHETNMLHHSASQSSVHVTVKVPTKQLAWKPVMDEFGAITEEKELTFTDL